MKLHKPALENDLVRLELLKEDHREMIRQSGATESMWEWLPVISTGTSFDSYLDYCLMAGKTDEFVPFVVYDKATGQFAGLAAYENVSRLHRRLGINFIWHPPELRGTAIVPATQLALLERAIVARIRRVDYYLPTENERALRSVERLGARRDGVLRSYMRSASGNWTDVAVLSLVGDEIKAATLLLRDRIRQIQLA
ncbi:MAG: GNAT family protein [Hyphomonas sp.]|uniref:GNAT family N-acetyltransferase n=1 Tax=Hyphomonas sp. TaxID=87 RepID=UPI0035296136